MQNEARLIHVTGTVQGVGFRPFVYRLAKAYGLSGYVKNLGHIVEIEAEGQKSELRAFLKTLPLKKPPLAQISGLNSKKVPFRGYSDFSILHSEAAQTEDSIIPPDSSLCRTCLSEILDPTSRYYHYPFTVCTNCGPRYTTVQTLPYDREHTTMEAFPLCDECNKEYKDPANRRYHAQPVCCEACGPKLSLLDSSGKKLAENYEAIIKAAALLNEGAILSIKGFGGFHIACSARRETAVTKVRERLKRPTQPFAVMAGSLETVGTFAKVEGLEKEILNSFRRPITLLSKKEPFPLAKALAPGLHNIGTMLPYTGIQYLLFDREPKAVYLLTSANLPGLPMLVKNQEALEKLEGIVDFHLLHNRLIANRNDDSVLKVVNGSQTFIRRSRGFVPEPLKLPFEVRPAIGVGAELNTTVTLAQGNRAYLSQYIGNTGKVETFSYHQEVVRHLLGLTGIKPQNWGCDLHPTFNTTAFAKKVVQKAGVEALKGRKEAEKEKPEKKSSLSLFKVQHHQAHILALMADNFLPKEARLLGVALDGVGYGRDGTIWGGELFESSYFGSKRLAHLQPQPMPGGDLAAKQPSRMVLGMFSGLLSEKELRKLPLSFKRGEAEFKLVLKQLEKGVNVRLSSSTGRVLDAASTLLGICKERSYEGEPAMKLEAAAKKSRKKIEIEPVFRNCEKTGLQVLDTSELLYGIYELMESSSPSDLAFAFEEGLACGISELACSLARKRGLDTVGLSGGVAYNEHITTRISEAVREAGFDFLTHSRVPCGDGGISFGQAIAAGTNYLSRKTEDLDPYI
ncbi:MAG: carbamoyltransferase HypF [Methanosarcinaceae archaeon]|nr:carbamoyltransferase HypF [Methanosarcinaceae archaeon]MDD4748726.1 carbamoyltransferase HypF [Methanosarcinaceae archaeon]